MTGARRLPTWVTGDSGSPCSYDGAPHLTREQQSRDNRRDEAFRSAGWAYFKVNADDLAEGFGGVIARIKRAQLQSA